MTDLGWNSSKRIRYWGNGNSTIIAIHGGPGAVGDMEGIASGLCDDFYVIEPWQRVSGEIPVTVNQHIEDLHGLIGNLSNADKPVLIGHSWGAMLALAYASKYPETIKSIALVGCGTFDDISRNRFKALVEERKVPDFDQQIERIENETEDVSERMDKTYALISKAYDVDLIEENSSMTEPFDYPAHKATWDDMMDLMNTGKYPQDFVNITVPVAMFHGDYDPHPGKMIFENLQGFIPQLEYNEFLRCGHSPWKEKLAKDAFFAKLRIWLQKCFQ